MRIGDSPSRGIGRRPPKTPGRRTLGSEEGAIHPGSDAILWTPWRAWVAETPADTGWDLVFTPEALAGVFDHFLSGDRGVGGTLTGVLLRCPRSGRRWVRVERAIPAPTALPDGSSAMALESALLDTPERPSGDTGAVGWYHSHGQPGVYLTEAEQRFHDTHFGEPWQFALIMVARSEPVGGIFQQPALTLPRGRKYVAFYELPAGRRSDGSVDTLIRWRNYRTDTRVTPVDAGSVRALASSASDEASTAEEALPTRDVPSSDEASIPEEVVPSEEVSTPAAADPFARARVGALPERPANRSRVRTALAAAGITVAIGAAGAAAWWLTRSADSEGADRAVFTAPGVELESPGAAPFTNDVGRGDSATRTDTAGRADTAATSLGRPDPDRTPASPESR